MFPIMMDEPDAMTVAPSVWHTLESAWRGGTGGQRRSAGAEALRAGAAEPQRQPSALAALALGHLEGSGGLPH